MQCKSNHAKQSKYKKDNKLSFITIYKKQSKHQVFSLDLKLVCKFLFWEEEEEVLLSKVFDIRLSG